MLKPQSSQWMTFGTSLEMKNAPISPKIGSFFTKYFGERQTIKDALQEATHS